MPRPFTPKIVTANDLVTGDVIYLAQDGSWVGEMCMAALLDEEDAANARLFEAETQPHIAVGPYLADAKAGANGPEPTHFREAFRAKGPSNRLHGKQERQQEVQAHV
ncbi:DUF2849 domain-containing protein [Aliiroseovarius sp. KMU-50]|uniref:DUF2849 domain-containing protein n=1 Tax=Aliiroseovarius salicola TaxID=3009082 RepID=A0ABT4W073_9RHOB|nr:DUF2849 domain-containing protein [Aliiroseovarius sp. KMU-50]MDA5093911.1 DUF2849 domain-containing protein [Aliiroseovarius sp. KMU-50]